MGAYLSAPVTHKEFFEGSSPDVIYGGASMQVNLSMKMRRCLCRYCDKKKL